MRQEIVRITDRNRCPYREVETDEYPSDRCTLSGWGLHQHTSGDFNRPHPHPGKLPPSQEGPCGQDQPPLHFGLRKSHDF